MNQYNGKSLLLGAQHVLAMYAGAIIVPLIVGSALKLTAWQMSYIIAADLLTSGLATLLQARQNALFGIGLPVVLGCTFTAVFPMITIGNQYGLPALYGSIICSGFFVVLIAKYFSKLVKFFPPVVTGSVVTIIGVTLVPVAINNMAGGVGSPDFGSLANFALAFTVLLFIILVNRFTTGFIRSISVLLGLIFGTVLAGLFGTVSLNSVAEASWFHMVMPLTFGMPVFEPAAVLTMIIVAIVSMIESTGVFMALGEICKRDLTQADLTRGYRAEGLAVMLGGFFNSFPYTTFSQNVGLVQLSNSKTANVTIIAGIMLMLLGFIPKFAALAMIIPNAVLGGAMVAMFGIVVASGIKMLSKIDFSSNENLLIIACSVALGLGVTVVPNLFAKFPPLLKLFLENGIVTGALTAVILNIILNMTPKKAVPVAKTTHS
ncbi:MAG: nucleobase:cation symporter-2 family protein [Sporomusaceae bacterium]|nr:nucleobase:cation symporter-2 family protein [Sporomusaceae bacterium]